MRKKWIENLTKELILNPKIMNEMKIQTFEIQECTSLSTSF